MVGSAQLGRGPGKNGFWLNQLVGVVGRAAGFAVVAVLIGCFAAWAAAHDKAVSQKQAFFRVVQLLHLFGEDQSSFLQSCVD
jgi:hypothetical protein